MPGGPRLTYTDEQYHLDGCRRLRPVRYLKKASRVPYQFYTRPNYRALRGHLFRFPNRESISAFFPLILHPALRACLDVDLDGSIYTTSNVVPEYRYATGKRVGAAPCSAPQGAESRNQTGFADQPERRLAPSSVLKMLQTRVGLSQWRLLQCHNQFSIMSVFTPPERGWASYLCTSLCERQSDSFI